MLGWAECCRCGVTVSGLMAVGPSYASSSAATGVTHRAHPTSNRPMSLIILFSYSSHLVQTMTCRGASWVKPILWETFLLQITAALERRGRNHAALHQRPRQGRHPKPYTGPEIPSHRPSLIDPTWNPMKCGRPGIPSF